MGGVGWKRPLTIPSLKNAAKRKSSEKICGLLHSGAVASIFYCEHHLRRFHLGRGFIFQFLQISETSGLQ